MISSSCSIIIVIVMMSEGKKNIVWTRGAIPVRGYWYKPSIELMPNTEPATCWNSTRHVFTDRFMHIA